MHCYNRIQLLILVVLAGVKPSSRSCLNGAVVLVTRARQLCSVLCCV